MRRLVLWAALGLLIGSAWAADLTLKPKFTYQASGEIRWAGMSDDGRQTAVIDNNSLKMLDGSGRARWTYKPPKTSHGYEVTLGRAHLISSDNTVVELWLAGPGDLEPLATELVSLNSKGRPRWKKADACSLVVPSPSGDRLLTTDFEMMETQLLDARTGRVIWTSEKLSGSDAVYSPDGKYAVVWDAFIVTLLSRAGRTLWSAHLDVGHVAVTRGAERVIMRISGEKLQVLCLDRSGKERWRKDLPSGAIVTDPAGRRILLGIDTAKFDGVKLLDSSGATVWTSAKELGEWDGADDLWISSDGKSAMFALTQGDSKYLYRIGGDGKYRKRALIPAKGSVEISEDGKSVLIHGETSVRLFRIL